MNTNQGSERKGLGVATACLKSCKKLVAQIEEAKRQLSAELRRTFDVPERMLRLAVAEAEALAWQTAYPQLVFPDLAMEKVRAVAGWNARQQALVRRELVSPAGA